MSTKKYPDQYPIIAVPAGFAVAAGTVGLVRTADGWHEIDNAGSSVKLLSPGEVTVLETNLDAEVLNREAADDALQAQLDALPAPFSRNYTDLTNRPTIPAISTIADLSVDPTLVTDRATLQAALDSLSLGRWLDAVPDIATRDAGVFTIQGAAATAQTNDRVRVDDAGAGTWVNYQATADAPTPNWQVISEENTNQILPALTEADAISGTATTDSTITATVASVVANAAVAYDPRATYGLNQRVYDPGTQNYYQSMVANNQGNLLNDAGFWEADLTTTSTFIRNLGAVATLTDADLAIKFPVGDESRPLDIITIGDVAYQQRIGTNNPQVASSWEPVSIPATRNLNTISVPVRSGGTNSNSGVSISFFDRDGNQYTNSNFTFSGTLIQWAGAGGPAVYVDRVHAGNITFGRNKTGTLIFKWANNDSLMNGLSRVNVGGYSGGAGNGWISGSFIGSSESFLHPPNSTISPPEEFSTAPRAVFNDNPDLSVNSDQGITRQGLANQLNTLAGWSTIQAAIDQDVTIASATSPSFIHLNGGFNGFDDWVTTFDVTASLDGTFQWVKAFGRDQSIQVNGANFLVDGATPTPSLGTDAIALSAGETVLLHHTLNGVQRFVNVIRMGGGTARILDPFTQTYIGHNTISTTRDLGSFVAASGGAYHIDVTRYLAFGDASSTGRISMGIDIRTEANGAGDRVFYRYLQRDGNLVGQQVDLAQTGNDAPYGTTGGAPVLLTLGQTYHVRWVSNTGDFRATDEIDLLFTQLTRE